MRIRLAKSFVTASFLWVTASSQAAVFTVDSNQTSITLSGSALGFVIEEQSQGSLTTHFSGRVAAEIGESSITFSGGSAIVAENNGSWEPKAAGEAGAEPANFGGKASGGLLGTVLAAVRNARFDVMSGAEPVTAGNFDSGLLLFEFIESSAGSLDYSVGGLFSAKGSIALAGLATNRVTSLGSISGASGARTLVIPIAADFYFKLLSENDVKLTITGQLVASEQPESVLLFDNGNIFAVQNGPSTPTIFTLASPTVLTYVQDYHYFNNGVLPGTIALRHEDGTMYGPWQTKGITGQGGVPNAYWFAEPFVTLKPGQYTVIDSDPGTWSHNSASGFAGFTYIKGYTLEPGSPELDVSLSAEGSIVLSWPGSATGFSLFRRSSLDSASPWMPVMEPPSSEGERLVLKLSPAGRSEFYRLTK